ncbi:MAG TPA: ribonuclease P protein component [Oligoflexia bacterium]|nr:ribonuclease P protein component [Oligoflexia bacterium]HMP26785.1 ribonuclease P protein component [Oligoflexia bacterium]
MPKFSFTKSARLLKSADYNKHKQRASHAATKYILMLIAKSLRNQSRLGITISTKIDKSAVRRNRFKRVVREWFRTRRLGFERALDISVIARSGVCELENEEIIEELEKAIKRYLKIAPR